MSEEEQENSGFKVVDRRREGRDGDSLESPAEEAPPEAAEPTPAEQPTQESAESQGDANPSQPIADFAGEEGFMQFIMSLATSAYMHLGLVPTPEGQAAEKNLPLAKQTIDILSMLEQKTQNNRNEQENAIMTQVLSELRMRYVDANKSS